MIELVRHIELLLLENDCVAIPGFGGFITYYMPASWDAEEKTFAPPVRAIGFNPQLKMNDGLLVQSYMKAYTVNFADAAKLLEQAVDELIGTLHKEGRVELANIGELTLSVRGTYVFSPYDDKIVSPFLYGLDVFGIKELGALQQPDTRKPVDAHKKVYEIRISRALVRNTAAAVAALLLFFYLSVPVANTYVGQENYAQLLSTDLFGKIERRSLLTASVGDAGAVVPAVAPAVKPEPAAKQYHIIVASLTTDDGAQAMAADLKVKGYHDASVVAGEGRFRVSICAYSSREEAGRRLAELRRDGPYGNVWLFIR
jgi:nucleoid DNA-binding protein